MAIAALRLVEEISIVTLLGGNVVVTKQVRNIRIKLYKYE